MAAAVASLNAKLHLIRDLLETYAREHGVDTLKHGHQGSQRKCESLVCCTTSKKGQGTTAPNQCTQKTPGRLLRRRVQSKRKCCRMLKDVARSLLLSFAFLCCKHHNFSIAASFRMQVLASIGRSSVAAASFPNLLPHCP